MLSTIPFSVDGIRYLIVFGELENHVRLEAPDTVFLHISNMTVAELQHNMARGVAHLGFGHGPGYVRDTPRGPQIEYYRWISADDRNCLETIVNAISQHLLMNHDESQMVSYHLSEVIEDLIEYVRLDINHLDPIKHLGNKKQTYIEFSMLLNAALRKRLEQSDPDGFCEGVNCCNFPMHCFPTTAAFAMWLDEWRFNNGHTLAEDLIVFESGSEGVSWMLHDLPIQTTRATAEPTDLRSRKRKLDQEFVSTAFYNTDS